MIGARPRGRAARRLAAAAVALAAAAGAAAEDAPPTAARPAPIVEGDSSRTLRLGAETVEVQLYRPRGYRSGPLLVVLPGGIARSALAYRGYARPIADAHGYLLAVPEFALDRVPFWRYAWAGIARRTFRDDDLHLVPQPPEQRLDALLRPLIDELRRALGEPRLGYALLGHGDGAAAALRWAAFEPNDALFVAVAGPFGWLLPTRNLLFPDGFGGLPPELAGETRLRAYLWQSVILLAATAGAGPDDPATERARNALAAARDAAAARHRVSHWRLVEVPSAAEEPHALFAAAPVLRALAPPRED